MSKRLLVLLTVVFAAFGTIALSGCGSSSDSKAAGSGGSKASGETVELDFAKVAQATKAKGSAEMALTVNAKDAKQTQSLTLGGKVDFKNGKADISADLGKVLESKGVPAGDGKVQFLVDGKKIWVHIPKIQGFTLPGGQEWISLDLQKVIDKLDVKEQAKKAEGQKLPPVKMTKVGTETLDGTEVTHLKSDATLREILNGVPGKAADRDQLIAKIEAQDGGKKLLDEPLPAEVWVDADNVLHRFKVSVSVDSGKTQGTADVDLTLKNFGTDVTIAPPSEGQTFNATDFLLSFADSFKDSVSKALKKS